MSALRDVSLQDPRLRYELVQRIGSGTYGDVYKVRASQRCAQGARSGQEGRKVAPRAGGRAREGKEWKIMGTPSARIHGTFSVDCRL